MLPLSYAQKLWNRLKNSAPAQLSILVVIQKGLFRQVVPAGLLPLRIVSAEQVTEAFVRSLRLHGAFGKDVDAARALQMLSSKRSKYSAVHEAGNAARDTAKTIKEITEWVTQFKRKLIKDGAKKVYERDDLLNELEACDFTLWSEDKVTWEVFVFTFTTAYKIYDKTVGGIHMGAAITQVQITLGKGRRRATATSNFFDRLEARIRNRPISVVYKYAVKVSE